MIQSKGAKVTITEQTLKELVAGVKKARELGTFDTSHTTPKDATEEEVLAHEFKQGKILIQSENSNDEFEIVLDVDKDQESEGFEAKLPTETLIADMYAQDKELTAFCTTLQKVSWIDVLSVADDVELLDDDEEEMQEVFDKLVALVPKEIGDPPTKFHLALHVPKRDEGGKYLDEVFRKPVAIGYDPRQPQAGDQSLHHLLYADWMNLRVNPETEEEFKPEVIVATALKHITHYGYDESGIKEVRDAAEAQTAATDAHSIDGELKEEDQLKLPKCVVEALTDGRFLSVNLNREISQDPNDYIYAGFPNEDSYIIIQKGYWEEQQCVDDRGYVPAFLTVQGFSETTEGEYEYNPGDYAAGEQELKDLGVTHCQEMQDWLDNL